MPAQRQWYVVLVKQDTNGTRWHKTSIDKPNTVFIHFPQVDLDLVEPLAHSNIVTPKSNMVLPSPASIPQYHLTSPNIPQLDCNTSAFGDSTSNPESRGTLSRHLAQPPQQGAQSPKLQLLLHGHVQRGTAPQSANPPQGAAQRHGTHDLLGKQPGGMRVVTRCGETSTPLWIHIPNLRRLEAIYVVLSPNTF